MTYGRTHRALHGCGCGMGGAMGDDAAASPYAQLAAQVNRFGPGAPAGLQFTRTPFSLTTPTLDPSLALTAVVIYQRRATDAYDQFHDAGSAAAIAAANLGLMDPTAFVSAKLPEVTSTVASYADSLGLPAADGISIPGLGQVSGMTLLLVAGAALAGYVLLRHPRRGS
jgi:hypothetical protein